MIFIEERTTVVIDYYEVFKKRALNKGKTFKERVTFNSQINFERFLISSPDAIDVSVNESKDTIRVASIYEKESDTLFKRFILSKLADNLKVGDFIYWEDSVWLLYKKEIDTIKAYDKFEAIDCRNTIKWIDEYGILQEVPCYLVAQTSNTIQPNFRTWNNMITPQPNKNLEIITSRKNIKLGEKFLIEDTAWHVVESDYISMKGILFLSLIEDKVDNYDDSIQDQVANFINLNNFTISIPEDNISLGIDDTYQIGARISNNGNYYSSDIQVNVIEGADCVQIDDKMNIIGLAEGVAVIRISFDEDSNLYKDLVVEVMANPQEQIVSYEFAGDDTIKWGRTKVYTCKKVVNGIEEPYSASFEIIDENNVLANYVIGDNVISVTANSSNKNGMFTLVCKPNDTDLEFRKECKVVSLWM
jgi:hypothetical protein